MRAVVRCAVALAFTLAAASAQAEFYRGNDLSEVCVDSETDTTAYMRYARCGGYILGVVDSITRLKAYDDALCLPDGVTAGQLTKVVEKFIDDNPAELHRPGAEVVAFAMFDAFPCE